MCIYLTTFIIIIVNNLFTDYCNLVPYLFITAKFILYYCNTWTTKRIALTLVVTIIIKQGCGSHLRSGEYIKTWMCDMSSTCRLWKPCPCSCAVSNLNSIVISVKHSAYLMPINVKYFLLVAKIVVWNADRISYKNCWQDRTFRKIKSDWLSDIGPESFKWDGGRFYQLSRSFDKKLRTYNVTIWLFKNKI